MAENSQEVTQFDVIQRIPSKFRDFFGAVVKLNENGIYHEPSCPVCCSKFRSEAETEFLKTPQYNNDKYNAIKAFLDAKGDCFSIDVVKNHCNSHINQGEVQLRKIEYINTIDNISSIKLSTLEEIDIMLAAIKERMIESSRLVSDGNRVSKIEAESIKSSIISNIAKSFATLLKLRAELLGEMKKDGEVIVISRHKFKEVFNEALDKSKSNEEKNTIITLLKNLSKAEDKSSL